MRSLTKWVALALSSAGMATASSACVGLGPTASDTLNQNFTLLATQSISDTTSQLVLSFGGAEIGTRLFVLSTFASSPENDFPSFALSNGTLIANQIFGDGTTVGIATGQVVLPGTTPIFLVHGALPPGAPIYCAIEDTDSNETAVLAVNGDPDSFSLCPETTQSNARVDVVWKPDSSSSTYIFDECLPVQIHIQKLP